MEKCDIGSQKWNLVSRFRHQNISLDGWKNLLFFKPPYKYKMWVHCPVFVLFFLKTTQCGGKLGAFWTRVLAKTRHAHPFDR